MSCQLFLGLTSLLNMRSKSVVRTLSIGLKLNNKGKRQDVNETQTSHSLISALRHSKRRSPNLSILSGPWKHTWQIGGEQPPLIPITKIGITRREKSNEKIDFCTLTFLKYDTF